jgi:hypothetical protein
MIFYDFIQQFWRFWSFLGDIGPFFRPDLGGKLGVCCQHQAYLNQRFLEPGKEVQNMFMLNIFQDKAIFMHGNR